MTKPATTHLHLGNPRTVCGRWVGDVFRKTRQLSETTCLQCKKHAPKDLPKVSQPNADKPS